MINLIFNNVLHKSGEKKTLNLAIDFCMVSWKIIFDFLQHRTKISYDKFKISVKNHYYTFEELSKSWTFAEIFEKENPEFISFSVKLYSPIDKQIDVLRASISSLKSCGQTTTDLQMKIWKLEKQKKE